MNQCVKKKQVAIDKWIKARKWTILISAELRKDILNEVKTWSTEFILKDIGKVVMIVTH